MPNSLKQARLEPRILLIAVPPEQGGKQLSLHRMVNQVCGPFQKVFAISVPSV